MSNATFGVLTVHLPLLRPPEQWRKKHRITKEVKYKKMFWNAHSHPKKGIKKLSPAAFFLKDPLGAFYAF